MLFFILVVAVSSFKLSPIGDCESDELCSEYLKSLKIAQYPSADRISKNLTPLRPSNPNLKFDSQGRVLMTSSANLIYFPYEKGQEFKLVRDSWFTAFPDLQEACKHYQGSDKKLRMKQQLGVPPTSGMDGVVELFINLEDIFRPCPDPEISDSECTLKIDVKNENSADPRVPWYCPEEDIIIDQVSGNWVNVERTHFEWMCQNWRNSYLNDEVYKNYPWTGLGYTYDWGSESGYGLSEFVVFAGNPVIFNAKYTIEEYCKL